MLDESSMETSRLRLSAVLSLELPALGISGAAEDFSKLLAESKNAINRILGQRRGELVRAIGDNFLAVFDNCKDAVDAALDISDSLTALSQTLVVQPELLSPRMGIHVGDVAFYEKSIFGPTVDTAEILRSIVRAGELCVSGEVLSLLGARSEIEALPLADKTQGSLPQGTKGYLLKNSHKQKTTEQPGMEYPKPGAQNSDKTVSLDEIRRAILDEIKKRGRRLSVDEARSQFGWYGLEATEVIASLAEAGILTGKGKVPDSQTRSQESSGSDIASEIGRSIESAVHAIVTEIERSVENKARHQHYHKNGTWNNRFDHFGDSLDKPIDSDDKSSRIAKQRSRRQQKNSAKSLAVNSFERYRKEIGTKAEKQKKGLAGGIISFVLVNAALWYINMNIATGFAWAPIVSTFWGFGLIESIFSARRLSRQARETDALPDLGEAQTKELKEIHKARNSIGSHFFSTLSISAGLTAISMATESSDPWHIIPISILSPTFLTFLDKIYRYLWKLNFHEII